MVIKLIIKKRESETETERQRSNLNTKNMYELNKLKK